MSFEEVDSEGYSRMKKTGPLLCISRKVSITDICSHVENMVNESGDLPKVISEHLANYNKMKEVTDNLKEKILNKKETGLNIMVLKTPSLFQMTNNANIEN